MTPESKSRSERLVDELSDLDQRSGDAPDNVALLQGMRDGLKELVEANDGDVAAIRSLLESSCESGELRRETLELVSSMLDTYAAGNLSTNGGYSTSNGASSAEQDDEFASTMVISKVRIEADRPDRRLQVGSVLRDRFLLQEEVPGGSMGSVYKALDRRLAETGEDHPFVAIKVVSPVLAKNAKALRALQQEAAKGRCLTHNHIVRFLDIDRDDELYFIVMEWLDGENLADMLDRGEAIDAARAFKITRQIGQALDYAHRCGIVHADIKPANVMIMPNGDAKLFDFGVARACQTAERSEPATNELGAMTPAYSSMQVLTGEEPVAEDDVFSLACLYYRLVAGYRVFGPRNAAEAAEAGMSPQPLQGVSDEQWKAVRKALSFARVTRYSTVGEFLEDLAPDEKTEAITADRESRIELEPDLPGSGRGPWLALVVLALLAGTAAYFSGYLDPYIAEFRKGVEEANGTLVDDVPPAEASSESEIVDLKLTDDAQPVTEATDDMQAQSETPSPAAEQPAPIEAPVFEGAADDLRDPEVAADQSDAQPPIESETIDAVQGVYESTVAESADESPANAGATLAGSDVIAPVGAPELPPGDTQLFLEPGGRTTVTLVEAGSPIVLDVIRQGRVERAERVFLSIGDYSGNRSPLETEDLVLSPSSALVFEPGVSRAQVTLSTRDDPVREADQMVTLVLRQENGAESVAIIRLQDDDQRRFEANLPANTVAFAAGQVSVEESDAAVQLDLVRFKPDAQALTVRFIVSDVTATADADYFSPADTVVEFGPGQRSARILVPLVQDNEIEGIEAFVLELVSDNQVSDAEIYQRIAVMIRDDD